jgi:peptide/nickel transport system substrate-binding protein
VKTSRAPRHVRPFGRTLRMIVGLATAVALTACGAGAGANSAGGSGEPKPGGDITFLIDSLGDTWIPNNSAISSFQGHIWGHVTDKLVYVDENGAVSPWIAESWEQNATATEFTLRLKRGVTFSDGTPLDAAAVLANLGIWAKGDPARGINPIGLFPKTYDHAEVVDPATVKVFFSAPTLGFIPTLGYHGSILISPKTIALPAAGQADLANDIGSGPFVVASWKEGDNVVLKKRADYNWGPKAPSRRYAPPPSSPLRPTSPTTPPRRNSRPSRTKASPQRPRVIWASSTVSR